MTGESLVTMTPVGSSPIPFGDEAPPAPYFHPCGHRGLLT